MLGVRVSLEFGVGNPAPGWMMEALDSVAVECSDQCPNGFQLSFNAPRAPGYYADNQLLSSDLLRAGARVIISATIAGTPSVLMDGFVTHLQLQAATMTEEAKLVVTGEDVSFQMSLYDYSLEYPMMPDYVIVNMILAKWIALGILPEVLPTAASFLSIQDVPQQAGNDRDYLQFLAQRNGCVFYVAPGPSSGMNLAYWGPPKTLSSPQPALSADLGPASNVNTLSFSFDATKPQRVWGAVLNTTINEEIPIATVVSTRVPPLASQPALIFDNPYVRTTMFQHQGLDVVGALALGQAITDFSTDQVVTGTGSLDALRYGRVLSAPGVVGVRGVGQKFDGNYYVQKVQHEINRNGWTQSFSLQREGLGSTVSTVRV